MSHVTPTNPLGLSARKLEEVAGRDASFGGRVATFADTKGVDAIKLARDTSSWLAQVALAQGDAFSRWGEAREGLGMVASGMDAVVFPVHANSYYQAVSSSASRIADGSSSVGKEAPKLVYETASFADRAGKVPAFVRKLGVDTGAFGKYAGAASSLGGAVVCGTLAGDDARSIAEISTEALAKAENVEQTSLSMQALAAKVMSFVKNAARVLLNGAGIASFASGIGLISAVVISSNVLLALSTVALVCSVASYFIKQNVEIETARIAVEAV